MQEQLKYGYHTAHNIETVDNPSSHVANEMNEPPLFPTTKNGGDDPADPLHYRSTKRVFCFCSTAPILTSQRRAKELGDGVAKHQLPLLPSKPFSTGLVRRGQSEVEYKILLQLLLPY